MRQLVWLILCLPLWAGALFQPLPLDQAYQFNVTVEDSQTIALHWKIAPGYLLYKDRMQFNAITPNTQLAPPLMPPATQQYHAELGNYPVYADVVNIALPVVSSETSQIQIKVHYQGCSLQGFCYPPAEKMVTVDMQGPYHTPIQVEDAPPTSIQAPTKTWLAPATYAGLFAENNLAWIMLAFMGFGLLLSLTPCVLPMIPILSSIIIGQKNPTWQRGLIVSASYVLGMACSYAAIGIIFAMIGMSIQPFLQNPFLLIIFSLLFIVMAFSLFGFYTIQLPAKWLNLIANASNQQNRGRLLGVFAMGFLATLILSPCVTPPLVAALSFISIHGNALIGGLALFSLGIGIGIPLLIIGTLGGKYLPKAGAWMEKIKKLLGILMLAIAIYLIQLIIPSARANNLAPFIPVKTINDVQCELTAAAQHHQPVLLDFYADWCVACKLMDRTVFNDPAIKKSLQNWLLLRANITANDVSDQALMLYYGIIAPPTILFFDKNGQEIIQARVVGEVSKGKFSTHLNSITS